MKFCTNCGTQLDDDAKFCHSCGTATAPTAAQPAVEPAAEQAATQPVPEQAAAPAQPAPQKKGKAKLLGAREKTAKFEKKHSLIVNLLVLCCSFVVLMVSLFAPIKVSGYVGTSGARELLYGDVSTDGADYVYMEVDQTIYDMIGALFYTFPGGMSKESINTEVSKELVAAASEYRLWRSAHPYASEIEMREAYAGIYADHLSNTNYLGYILANSAPFVETQTDISYDDDGYEETTNYSTAYMGTFIASTLSVTIGLAIAIIAIVMAILSLINLIKAIVGLCKKKTIVNFDKYMFRMLALSGTTLVLMWVSPLLETGGGMFGISMFVAITLLVTGILRSLFVRGDNWLGTIKRGVMALLCMLAFYLLCGNTFILRTYQDSAAYSFNVKPGYAFYNLFTIYNTFGSGMAAINPAPYIMGFGLFLLTAGFIMSFSYKVFNRVIHNVANGDKNNKSAHGILIAVAVLTLVGLICGLLSGQLMNLVAKGKLTSSTSVKWLLSGHVWASLVFTILAIVLHFAFKPENIGKGKSMIVLPALETEPATAAATESGAPAEEQNHDAVSTTETPEQPAEQDPFAEQAPAQEDNA